MKLRIVTLSCIVAAICLSGLRIAAQSNAKNGYASMPAGIMHTDFLNVATDKHFKLEDLKGKVVVINFWGIWCGPCVPQVPHLISLDEKYRSQGLKVIGFNVGTTRGKSESAAAIKNYAERYSIKYDLTRISESDIKKIYLIAHQEVLPQTVVLDGDGRIRGTFVGGGPRIYEQIETLIDKLMHE